MSDFFKIDTRPGKRGVTEIYPKFIVGKPNDLMIRGSDFYAIWMEERGLWSTDEQDVIRTIDRELRIYADEYQKTHDNGFHVLYMWDAESGMIDNWHKYCQRQMRDNFHPLDEGLIFSNTPVKKESYASKRLPYPLEPGNISAYDELMGVLYSPEEREKLEWAVGSVVNGDSKARYGYVPGDNEKEGGEWTATGTQFQVPYVFKTLFSHEDIVFNDLCETKSVSKGAIYLDKNEDLAEGEHNYIFVGRVGQFCPIKSGCGGALLVREAGAKDNGETKYDSVTGAKDYRWLESEMVYNLHLEETIDRSYFDKMATKAVEAISEYGDFDSFASDDTGLPPWQKPDIPWDDVQDEAAQNFDVR